MSRYNVQGTLGSTVANGATFTVSYPAGTNKGDFAHALAHGLSMGGMRMRPYADFLVTPGTSSITVTNRSGASWTSGTEYILSLDERGVRGVTNELGSQRVNSAIGLQLIEVNLGAPAVADADGICKSQAVDVSEADAVINGDVGSVLDVPRNVVAAWTGTAVCTVYGEDEYGQPMAESSASGTSMTGKKAFKKVTRVAFSADVTAATVGTGDVLGLPVFVSNAVECLAELEDAAKATAGTIVVGATAKPTATTGDVRGTYDPNSACDGSKVFRLWFALSDPTWRGAEQYAG